MGNVQMEADQIRYKDSSGTYRNVQTGLAAAIAGGGGGSSTLAGLTDTAITTPSNGQVLTYDSTAEKWENSAIPAQSIDGLSDTTITTPSDGQVLTYDSTAEKWENATPASEVKSATFSGTTSASGNVIIDSLHHIKVLSAFCDTTVDDSSVFAVPLYLSATSTGLHLMKAVGGAAVASTEVSGTYYYID